MPAWSYPRLGKRALDVVVALGALVALSPLAIVVALAIKIDDGGPVLFAQQRVGRAGRLFRMLKFRTMPVATAQLPSSQAASLPVTRVGRHLRRLNLDELPQLVNVLRGDMSIVGPRPALPEQSTLLGIRRRNGSIGCRPGLTGLAQVHAYDAMPELEKAALDGSYARDISLAVDVRIVAKTVPYLMRRPPVY